MATVDHIPPEFLEIKSGMTEKEVLDILGSRPYTVQGSGILYFSYVIDDEVKVWIRWEEFDGKSGVWAVICEDRATGDWTYLFEGEP